MYIKKKKKKNRENSRYKMYLLFHFMQLRHDKVEHALTRIGIVSYPTWILKPATMRK